VPASLSIGELAGSTFGKKVSLQGEVIFVVEGSSFILGDGSGKILVHVDNSSALCDVRSGMTVSLDGETEEDKYSDCLPSRVRIRATAVSILD
jgi:uncharacterized protein YdeI (BOF family)